MKALNQRNIEAYALSIDIPIIGFSSVNNDNNVYVTNLEAKQTKKMLYPRNQNIDQYYDISLVMDNAKTIISIGIPYSQDTKYESKKNSATFSITSYGIDYHKVAFEKMNFLKDFIEKIDSSINFYTQCDTGVLDDRYFAYLCKNGTYGKHSQIINPDYGSQVFYATIIIDKEIELDNKAKISDLCGDCRLCLDACPSNSIDNYQVNYNSCISYISQSNKLIDPKLFDNCFYGCDICANVCPYNKVNSFNVNFSEKNANIDILDFLYLSKKEYINRYNDKSFSWLNRNILRKNLILMLDVESSELIKIKEKLLEKNDSQLLKEAFEYKIKKSM